MSTKADVFRVLTVESSRSRMDDAFIIRFRGRILMLPVATTHSCSVLAMSESWTKIYLIAGATRGLGNFTYYHHYFLRTDALLFLGLGLVNVIATRDPSAIIYAGARDPENGASYLVQVAAQYPGRVEIVKYVAGDKEGNDAIAKEICTKHGRVDTVIANAGAILFFSPWFNSLKFPSYCRHCELRRKDTRNTN
jgi:hypothetical protein